MARCALILVTALLAGCATDDQKMAGALSAAAVEKAVAEQAPKLPATLPEACTAKMARSRPAPGEPWVINEKRWNIYADARDRKAENCRAWWTSYRGNMGAAEK